MNIPRRSVHHSAAALALGTFISVTAFGANDPNSFGRSVKYLDMGTAQTVIYQTGANFPCPAGVLCKNISTDPVNQTFNDADRIVIKLPAGSTNSLLCFSHSPSVNYQFINATAANQPQSLTTLDNVTLDSAVLANPTLINKVTGQPFNGSVTFQGIGFYAVYKTMAANTSERQALHFSRECVGGLINLKSLQTTFGLTLAQAQSVLRSAMTVRFATSTTTMALDGYVSLGLGVRLFGD